MFPFDQTDFRAAVHDLFKELLKQVRFLEAAMTILGKRGVMRNFLIEAEPGEPPPSEMHAQLFDQFALAGDAIQIPDQQNTQEELRINRRSAGLAVGVFQLVADEVEADVSVNETE